MASAAAPSSSPYVLRSLACPIHLRRARHGFLNSVLCPRHRFGDKKSMRTRQGRKQEGFEGTSRRNWGRELKSKWRRLENRIRATAFEVFSFLFASTRKGRNGFALFRGFFCCPDTLDGLSTFDSRLEHRQNKKPYSPPPALGHAEFGQKRVVDGGRKVDHRLAEPDDVVASALRRRRARSAGRYGGRV